jgi:hypothetical protein
MYLRRRRSHNPTIYLVKIERISYLVLHAALGDLVSLSLGQVVLNSDRVTVDC